MSYSPKERKNISTYHQLSELLNSVKSDKISVNDAMNKLQLKDTKPPRPYCKATASGALALYGISLQPIVLYADQWNKLIKIVKSDYVDNYIKYNESRLKFKKYIDKSNNTRDDTRDDIVDDSTNNSLDNTSNKKKYIKRYIKKNM